MKYYDTEYRHELITFLDGYKNILIYLKDKDEGIAEVLISDSLKKLEYHIKIITPGRFDALSVEVKKLKGKQAEDYYTEQIEELKKEQQSKSEQVENNTAAYNNIFNTLTRIEQQLSELKLQRPAEKINTSPAPQVDRPISEEDIDAQLEAQFQEPDALL